MDVGEHYPKRTFRNRMVLATANGAAQLTIPVERRGGVPRSQAETRLVRADAEKRWRAVRTAYGAAPFFEEMAPELGALFLEGPATLGEWNVATLAWAAEWLGVGLPAPHEGAGFNRSAFSHEAQDRHWQSWADQALRPWPHVWADRVDLKWSSLSVLDLVLHCGPASAAWVSPIPQSGFRRPE